MAIELKVAQAQGVRGGSNFIHRLINKQPDRRHEGWKAAENLAGAVDRNAALRTGVEDQTNRIGPGARSRQGILGARDPADFDARAIQAIES